MNQLKAEIEEAKKIQEAYKQVMSLNKKLVARIKVGFVTVLSILWFGFID